MKLEKLREAKRIKILIFAFTALLIILMFPKGESIEAEVNIGSIWLKDDLIAPFSFPILKNVSTYNQEVENAQNSIVPVFVKRNNIPSHSIDSIKSFNNYLIGVLDRDISNDNTSSENITYLSDKAYFVFKSLRSKDKSINQRNGVTLSSIFLKTENFLRQIYFVGLLSVTDNKLSKDSIAIRTGNIDEIDLKSKYYDEITAIEPLKNQLIAMGINEEIRQATIEYAKHFLNPNIVFDKTATEQERELARNKISKYTGIVNENERIIAKHDRITQDTKLKIDSYRTAKAEMMGTDDLFLQQIGKFLHISFLLLLMGIYLYHFRRNIYNNNFKLLIFSIMFIWISFITFIINLITFSDAIRLLIFIPAASMLLTIIFDSRVGFYGTVIISLITGALRGNDYTFVVMNIVAGALSVYTVRDIKNRSQIFRSFTFILIGYFSTILAFGLERFESWEKIFIEFSFAATNSLVSPVLTFGLLIFFERFFKITTDLTLLELSNFDRPLLRELARKAPGTFNHSITMGTLAEAAAEVIQANPLLARVGAYYHDIGKSIAPHFFVENQLDQKNPHEEILPIESVKVLNSHIIKGIELGRQSNLPEEVIDFIPMHHGTNIITYFYQKAKNLYGEDNVNVNDYKYSGPIPNSKETAIVMLADACESAIRTVENPDTEKVEAMINYLIQSRIDDGQLDNAPLTFKEIKLIKESFISILMGQRHKRIRYPNQDELLKKD